MDRIVRFALSWVVLPIGLMALSGCIVETRRTSGRVNGMWIENASSRPRAGSTPGFTCTIASASPVYRVGQAPKITVGIRNQTGRSIYLVGSLEGSSRGLRYPQCGFSIRRADGRRMAVVWPDSTAASPIRRTDFVQVPPGGVFDPYGPGFVSDFRLSAGTFGQPGEYRIRFHYSTASDDANQWLGVPAGLKVPRNPEFERLLAQVPKVSMVSNEISVNIGE